MVDWPGLLKWSLAHKSNLKETKIPPLTPEQQKFLEEAIEAATYDEVKRMEAILKILGKDEKERPDTEVLLDLLDELQDILSTSTMPENFCKIGGPFFLLTTSLNKEADLKLRIKCLILISDIAANNVFVQSFFCKVSFFELVDIAVDTNNDEKLRNRAISALNAIIKGGYLVTKRIFLAKGGYEKLLSLLKEEPKSYYVKLFRLLSELYAYENLMHKKVDMFDNFNNDMKKLEDEKNFIDLKDMMSKCKLDFDQAYLVMAGKIFNSVDMKNTNLRDSLAFCLLKFYQNKRKLKNMDVTIVRHIRKIVFDHFIDLAKAANKDDVYESELTNVKTLLKTLDI